MELKIICIVKRGMKHAPSLLLHLILLVQGRKKNKHTSMDCISMHLFEQIINPNAEIKLYVLLNPLHLYCFPHTPEVFISFS